MEQGNVNARASAPGQQPVSSSAAPTAPERHRLHSSYIWLGSLRIVIVVAIAVFAGAADSIGSIIGVLRDGQGSAVLVAAGIFIVSLIVILGIAFGYQAWSYKHIYYEIGAEEFSFYRGIFSKKRMHVPYQRVQSVNHRASILQRLVGVCTVKIDTAGGAANEGISIPYVTKAAAEQLRRELFARKAAILSGGAGVPAGATQQAEAAVSDASPRGGNVLDGVSESLEDARGIFGGEKVDTGRISYEYRLTNKELLLSAMTNNAAAGVAVIGLLGSLVSVVGGLFGSVLNSMRDSVLSFGTGFAVMFGVMLFLGLIVFLWAVSVGVSVLAYGGFRAVRRDKRIEVEYGLLSRSFHGLDIDRVQSVIVKQGFIRRLFGYCELSLGRIDSASQNGQNKDSNASLNQGLVVHPFVKLARVPEILDGLAPEFADVPTRKRPVARVALRRALVRRCTWGGFGFWLLVCAIVVRALLAAFDVELSGIASFGFFAAYVLGVVLIVLDGVSAVLWYRGSGFAFNRDFLRVVNGGFSTKSVTFPRKKIQYGYLATNPLQRLAQVATLHAKSAAGVGTDVKLMDVSQADADAWFAWLHPHGNRAA